jgi:uncharacterized protein
MNHTEQVAVFACAGESLVGVLSRPEQACDTAVVVIVGGPQYRAGSHRQFVLLARRLAAAGYPVLRFDYRGMGDSSGEPRDFEQVSADVAAAIDLVIERTEGVERVVLWGLCDGASAALLYCHATADPRVAGLCLLNPWVRSEAGLARTQVKHYYLQRLMQREFWAKLMNGQVGVQAIAGLAKNVRTAVAGSAASNEGERTTSAAYQHRMADAWRRFEGRLLLLLSGNDYTAKEFLECVAHDAAWRGALNHAQLRRVDIADADHTFSDPASSRCAEDAVLAWLAQDEALRRPSEPVALVACGERA